MKTTLAVKLILAFSLFHAIDCSDLGTLACKNGAWNPDAKLIGFGLSCPLPLDGKAKSKGKTTVCAFKKTKVYDGKTVQTDKIAPTVCAVFSPEKLQKDCNQKIQACLKNGKGYFKDPKKDTEYKTWSPAFECLEKWISGACKK